MGLCLVKVVLAWRGFLRGFYVRSVVRAFLRDPVGRRINLTSGRRVMTAGAMIPLAAARLGRRFQSWLRLLKPSNPSVADPDRPRLISPRLMRKRGVGLKSGGGLQDRPLDDDAGADELPQRDEQLSREGDGQALARGLARHGRQTLTMPARQRRLRLVDKPQPGELQHFRAQPRIAGFRHPLLAIDLSASPRRRRQAAIGAGLATVGDG